MQVDLADPVAERAPHPARVARRRHPAQRREQDGRDGDAEDPLGQHVEPEGVVDGGRGVAADQRSEAGVDEDVQVDDPDRQRHRQEEDQHLMHPGVAPVKREGQRVLDAPQRPGDHQELNDRRDQPGDRVRVDAVLVALEPPVQDHQEDDDHDVPDGRSERRDRELVVGLEDRDEQAGEAEQQHDGEQHARQPGGQRGRDVGSGEQRHHDARDPHVDERQRAEREQDQPEQRRGQPERLALLAGLRAVR